MEAFKEKEYKMLLKEAEYQMILDHFDQRPIRQTNTYYLSNSKTAAFRTRKRLNETVFTLKAKKDDYNDEYEFAIKDNPFNDQRVLDLFNQFNISSYSLMAKLITDRLVIKLDQGEICLDKNCYLGIIDYEIEYELYDAKTADNSELIAFLHQFQISYRPNLISKYRRCMEEYYKMKTIILLAPGVEECEALLTYDLLYRAGVDVKLVGLKEEIISSHDVKIIPQLLLEDVREEECNCLILPGGIPGTPNLEACPRVQELIDSFLKNGKYVAAICAAPSILAHKGLLKDEHFICHPGFECGLKPANVKAYRDGQIITGKGVGATFEFAYEILKVLRGEDVAEEIMKKTQYR